MPSHVAELVRKIYQEQLEAPKRRGRKWETVCTVLGAFLAALFVAGAVYYYNVLVKEYGYVRENSAQIRKELDRKRNLLPNLIRTVRNHSAYEQIIFRHTSDSRSGLITGRQWESELNRLEAVGGDRLYAKLVALAEQYPDLKSNKVFLELMKNAANSENRLAAAREKYNISVRRYNSLRARFPAVVFAVLFRFDPGRFYDGDAGIKVPAIGEFEK